MTTEYKPDESLTAAAQFVRRLVDVGDFGHPTTSIEIVETHISWVLLTGQFAYKIKKPVNLGFLDFSTLELRHKYCLLELDLNRRFAPELYLDVVPIGGQPDRPGIGITPTLEWAVRMRQFPSEARLDRQIQRQRVSADDMRAFGESLAQLHELSPSAHPDDGHDSVGTVTRAVEENFSALTTHCPDADLRVRLENLADWSTQELQRLAKIMCNRQVIGHVRECHGDLHLENLVQLSNRIMPFDCIEFDAELRYIDVMNEVAFLFMDTLRIARPDLGYSFLNRYLEVSGDYAGIALLPFYCVYRCLVRAKIVNLRQAQNNSINAPAELSHYIELAERLANLTHDSAEKQPPCLIICRGLSGSGKTYLSSQLLSTLPAIRIRSDIVRKQLHAIGEFESSGSPIGQGLYDASVTSRTYEMLAQLSTIALTAGYDVIVDATGLRQADRGTLQSVATKCAAGFAILDCTAADQILAERVISRHAARRDASEADLKVLEWQRANFEPLSNDEQHRALTVDTGKKLAADKISRQLREIAAKE